MLRGGTVTYDWNIAYRAISIGQQNAQQRLTVDYRVNPLFTAGLEFNPVTQEVQPRATWFAVRETKLPSVVLGASADRLSTAQGHAVFLTFAKSLEGGRVLPFGSIKLTTNTGAIAFPFGVNLMLTDHFTVQVLNDGDFTHLIGTAIMEHHSISLMLARAQFPGVQVGYRF